MARSRRLTGALTCALLVGSLLAGPEVPAAPRGAFTLASASGTASWTGSFDRGQLAVVQGLPEACLTNDLCDTVELDVALPAGTWTGAPGGMLVEIQWPTIDAGYDLDLFVYDSSGNEVARSDTWQFSRQEAAWIEDVANDTYTVVVVPKDVLAQPVVPDVLTPLTYEGYVQFERGVTVRRPELNNGLPYEHTFVAFGQTEPSDVELLPDLVPTTPRSFHIESGFGAQYYFYGDRGLRHQPSCYPQETTGLTADDPASSHIGALRCLRWDQGEYNVGDGPLEVHNYAFEGDGTNAYQRIYTSKGDVRQFSIGTAKFSPNHGHMHLFGFQSIGLYADAGGAPDFDNKVSSGIDKGICMVDIEDGRFKEPNASPHGYPLFGTCDNPSHMDYYDPTFPNSPYFQMGISVGYADVYPWFIADQYLDISDPGIDGKYWIVVRQNVSGKIVEKSTANNEATACVEIHGTTVTPC